MSRPERNPKVCVLIWTALANRYIYLSILIACCVHTEEVSASCGEDRVVDGHCQRQYSPKRSVVFPPSLAFDRRVEEGDLRTHTLKIHEMQSCHRAHVLREAEKHYDHTENIMRQFKFFTN